jgi:hypothetical protein
MKKIIFTILCLLMIPISAGSSGFFGGGGTSDADGASAYVYIGYASDASGTGFTTTFDSSLNYIAILPTETAISAPAAENFTGLWKNYKGATGAAGSNGTNGSAGSNGANAYVYIAYASDDSGTGFTTTFNASLNYLAVKSSSTVLTPIASDFTGLWFNYKGATGAAGAQGIQGIQGVTGAAGPNNVTTSTTTNLTGILSGNGSVVGSITDNHSNWDAAYGWGNHASGGYEVQSNKSTDIATDAVSNTKYPGVKAIKDYADGLVVGLLNDRGNYDPTATSLYPATGGSGTAGAILKGNIWFISVAGTINGHAVAVGSSLRALADTPAQSDANWDILNVGLGYTPENATNKVTSVSGSSTDTQYPSAKLFYDQLAGKQASGSYLTAASTLDATKLSGNLPAISGASLTGVLTSITDSTSTTSSTTAASATAVKAAYDHTGGAAFCTYKICASDAKNKEGCTYTCDGTDDQVQMQAAVDASSGSALICLSDGVFVNSAAVNIDHGGISFKGAGKGGTQINNTSSTADTFYITATDGYISDMTIVNTSGTTPTAGAGIHVSATSGYSQQWDFNRLQVYSFFYGFNMERANTWNITNSYFLSSKKYGVYVRNTDTPDAGDSQIFNNVFDGGGFTPDAAIRWESSGGLQVMGNKILNHKIGIDAEVANGVTTSDLLIQNNSIEGQQTNYIKLGRLGTTGIVDYINITGNQCSGGVTDAGYSISSAGIRNINIAGNIITGANQHTAIDAATTVGLSINSNHFEKWTTGINLASTVSSAQIGPNNYVTVTNPIINAAIADISSGNMRTIVSRYTSGNRRESYMRFLTNITTAVNYITVAFPVGYGVAYLTVRCYGIGNGVASGGASANYTIGVNGETATVTQDGTTISTGSTAAPVLAHAETSNTASFTIAKGSGAINFEGSCFTEVTAGTSGLTDVVTITYP